MVRESNFRACLGCSSLVLGVMLLAASVCKMYVDLSDRVGMAIAARGLMQRAVAAKCDYYDPENDNQVVYLSDCETNIKGDQINNVREGLLDVAPGTLGLRIGKGYMVCSKRKFRVDVQGDDVASNGSSAPLIPVSQVLRECTDVAENSQSQLEQPICNEEQQDEGINGAMKKGVSTVRGPQPLQQAKGCQTVSVIALQTKHALVPMTMNGISFFMVEKGAVDVYNFAEKAQVHRPLPQHWTIILIFAGLFTMNLGFSEIPLYKLPVFCQFHHCSFALMATLAVMSTAIISGLVFGAAWTRYNFVLAVPMFVISLASLCLLGYVRCRCAAEDSDDEYERPVKDVSESTEPVVIDRRFG